MKDFSGSTADNSYKLNMANDMQSLLKEIRKMVPKLKGNKKLCEFLDNQITKHTPKEIKHSKPYVVNGYTIHDHEFRNDPRF